MVSHIAYQGEFTRWTYFPGPFAAGLCKIHLPFAINGDAGTRMSQSRVRGSKHYQRCDHDCCFCLHGCAFAVVVRSMPNVEDAAGPDSELLGKTFVADGSRGLDVPLSFGQSYPCSLGGSTLGLIFVTCAAAKNRFDSCQE